MKRLLKFVGGGMVIGALGAPYYAAEYCHRLLELVRWATPADVHLGVAQAKLESAERIAVDAKKDADACSAEKCETERQLGVVRKTKEELGIGLDTRKAALAAAAALSPEALAAAKQEFGQWLAAYKDALATEEKLLARIQGLQTRNAKLESLALDVIGRVDDARSRLANAAVDVAVGQSDELLLAVASTVEAVGSQAREPREFAAVLARLRAPMARTVGDMSVAELTAQAEEVLAK